MLYRGRDRRCRVLALFGALLDRFVCFIGNNRVVHRPPDDQRGLGHG